jgi:hypothetical protein
MIDANASSIENALMAFALRMLVIAPAGRAALPGARLAAVAAATAVVL